VFKVYSQRDTVCNAGRPVFLDTVTYRINGHSPSDASSYRSKKKIERQQQADPTRSFRGKLIENACIGRRVARQPARRKFAAQEGNLTPKITPYNVRDAIFEALHHFTEYRRALAPTDALFIGRGNSKPDRAYALLRAAFTLV
jgi:TPP-dependent pyruvate/acetoin dehydrogenase alpha subunit